MNTNEIKPKQSTTQNENQQNKWFTPILLRWLIFLRLSFLEQELRRQKQTYNNTKVDKLHSYSAQRCDWDAHF